MVFETVYTLESLFTATSVEDTQTAIVIPFRVVDLSVFCGNPQFKLNLRVIPEGSNYLALVEHTESRFVTMRHGEYKSKRTIGSHINTLGIKQNCLVYLNTDQVLKFLCFATYADLLLNSNKYVVSELEKIIITKDAHLKLVAGIHPPTLSASSSSSAVCCTIF